MVTLLTSKMAGTNFQNTLDNILKQAMKVHHAKRGNMQIINRQQNHLEIVAHHGFNSTFIDYFKVVNTDDGTVCSRALKSGQTVFVADVMADEEFTPHLHVANDAGFRTVISSPLISSSGNAIGVISTHFNLPHRFTKKELVSFEKFCCDASDTSEKFLFN